MKTLTATLLAIVALQAGCSNDSRPGVAGIKMPSDTTATLLTGLPAQQVANCIAGGLHTSAQPEGSGYIVVGTGHRPVTYRIHSVEDKMERFTTQIDQLGEVESSEFVAATCLLQSDSQA